MSTWFSTLTGFKCIYLHANTMRSFVLRQFLSNLKPKESFHTYSYSSLCSVKSMQYMFRRLNLDREGTVTCIICLGWSSEKFSLLKKQSETQKMDQSSKKYRKYTLAGEKGQSYHDLQQNLIKNTTL